ncbi:MAG: S8 family peptidase [Bdellovibrionia bacterium]
MRRFHLMGWVGSLISLAFLVTPLIQATASNESNNHYILSGVDESSLKEMLDQVGGIIIKPLRYQKGWVVELQQAQALELQTHLAFRAAMRTMSSTFLGTAPEPKEVFEEDRDVMLIDAATPAIVTDDTTLRYQQRAPWGIRAIHAPEAFSISRGKGATVCIIDTGIQKDHPDLEGSVIGGESTLLTQHSGSGQDWPNWEDDQGHGTHVAGTIAARDNSYGVVGVAPEAKLFVVKALNARGSGNFSTVSEGIRSCIAHHANVINLSLGSSDESVTIKSAIRDALDAGIVVVAAAGNEKRPVDFPANVSGVIAVSSLSRDLKFSYFSNRGEGISFIAPGEDILSTFPGSQYAYAQGTSQASPHVAGVAALLVSRGIPDVKEHLEGIDLGLRPELQGKGLIDAYSSLR